MTNPMKAKALNNIGPDLAAFKNKVKYLPEVLTEGFEGLQQLMTKRCFSKTLYGFMLI